MNYQVSPNLILTSEIRQFLLHHAIKNDRANMLLGKVKGFTNLKKVEESEYTCSCPWCGSVEGFTFNKKSGDCSCSACSKAGDLIDLIQETTNTALYSIMSIISVILEMWGMP